MTEPTKAASPAKKPAHHFYKEERVSDPLIGCVDFNALHDDLAAAKPAKAPR